MPFKYPLGEYDFAKPHKTFVNIHVINLSASGDSVEAVWKINLLESGNPIVACFPATFWVFSVPADPS
jgi:hypothetical protein